MEILKSRYFTLRELTRSAAALKHKLDNTPDAAAVARLQALVTHVLDPLRQLYGAPIMVTSGYRSPAVNAAVGGAAHSQHLLGEAADITTGSPEGNRRLLGLILSPLPAPPRGRETKALTKQGGREGGGYLAPLGEIKRRLPFDQLIAEKCDSLGRPAWIHISYSDKNRNQVLYDL